MKNGNPNNVNTADSTSFKYKSVFSKTLPDDDNGVFKKSKMAVPLKYLSRKYFLPRVNMAYYNVLTASTNFYDQPNIDQTKKYDAIRKIATGQGDDYTTGCLFVRLSIFQRSLSINYS